MSSFAIFTTNEKVILEIDVAPSSYLDGKMGDYMIQRALFISKNAEPIITNELYGDKLFAWLRENNFRTVTKEERCLYELAR